MRKKFIKELRNNLIKSNIFWRDDIEDMLHIANMTYKKCYKDFRQFKKKKKESKYK